MRRAVDNECKPLKWFDGFNIRTKLIGEQYAASFERLPENGAAREYTGEVGDWRDGMYCLNSLFPSVSGTVYESYLVPKMGTGVHDRIGHSIQWKRLQLDVHLAPRILPTSDLLFSGPERLRFLLVHTTFGREKMLTGGYGWPPYFGDILQSTRYNGDGTLRKCAYTASKQNHSNDRLFTILRDEWRTIGCHPDIEFAQGLPEQFQDLKHGSFAWDVDLTGLFNHAPYIDEGEWPWGYGGGDLIFMALSDTQYENLGVPGTAINWTQVQFRFNFRVYFEDA